MSTLIEKVNYIENIKSNIGKAITDKGGSITNDFGSYVTAVNNLPTGEGGGGEIGPGCVDFGKIGYKAEDITALSTALAYSKLKLDEWNPETTKADQLYFKDKKLFFAPFINTSKVISMIGMFRECENLKTIPQLDTINVTNMAYTFKGCILLTSIPQLDTSKVTVMSDMFSGCSLLTSIPQLDTSKVTDMRDMFNFCKSLTSIPQLDTINVTNMAYAFKECSSLTSIPQLDTSKVTNMDSMFYGCSSLTSIPQLDTSNATNMDSMFNGCSSLTSIPLSDTSKVTDMTGMLGLCEKIFEIPYLNTEKVETFFQFTGPGILYARKINELSMKSATNTEGTFSNQISYIYVSNNIRYMLLKDLGTPESVTSYDFSKCDHWGEETDTEHPEIDLTGAGQTVVDSLLTYSFDRKTAGYATCTFKCHPNMKQYLTEEQITAIQNKGYTITF